MIDQFCNWLAGTPVSQAFQDLRWFVPTVQTVHILCIAVIMTSVGMLAFKLLGLAGRAQPQTLPLTWSAFAVAAGAGLLLFTSKAVTYYSNIPFRVKMICIVLAGLNMACFHRLTYPKVAEWNQGPPPFAARFAGGMSLMLWIIIVAAGRWVGFTTDVLLHAN